MNNFREVYSEKPGIVNDVEIPFFKNYCDVLHCCRKERINLIRETLDFSENVKSDFQTIWGKLSGSESLYCFIHYEALTK